MGIVIRIIGVAIVLLGLVYLVKPEIIRALIRFFSVGSRVYLAAVIRFTLAVVFFLGARECRYTWLIILFGILFLASGLLIIILGPSKVRQILNWYLRQPVIILRFLSLIVVIFGLIIVGAA